MEFALSEDQRMLQDSISGNLPIVHPEIGVSERAAVERAWDVPIPTIAEHMDDAVAEAMDTWGGS